MQEKLTKSKIRAKLKKLEKLSYTVSPEEILVGLEEILETNPDDIDTLNFMADMLHQLGRKEESCAISQRVLELDWSNSEANINVGSIKWDIIKIIIGTFKDKSELLVVMINLLVFFVSIIGAICLSFYNYPQQESMMCDSHYVCSIEHVFYKNYKGHENLKLSKNTIYYPIIETSYKIKHRSHGASTKEENGYIYKHSLLINEQFHNIFKNTLHSYSEYELKIYKENETQKFDNYKKNPNLHYQLQIYGQIDRCLDIVAKFVTLLFLQYLFILLLVFFIQKFKS